MTLLSKKHIEIDKSKLEHFCYIALGLPESKRVKILGKYNSLAQWEQIIIEESSKYTEQELSKPIEYGDVEVKQFCDTFCDMLNSIFTLNAISRLAVEHHIYCNAICCSFMFGNGEKVSYNSQRAIEIYKQNDEQPILYYEDHYIFIVASNALKNWLKTTAIWTVDGVLQDIIEQGS